MVNKWDKFYLELAEKISELSKDPSTKTGAVIVTPDNVVLSMGYNGFPRKIEDTEERLNDRETKYELIVHCEMNALIHAERNVSGHTLYTWPFLSCPRCAVHMIQAGITRVVAPRCPADKLDRWNDALERTKKLFDEAGIEVVEVEWHTG
jgi:dCMP deaminase